MAVPTVLAGSAHELLDLALGKIAAFDCEVFSVRCAASGYLIYHDKSLFCKLTGKIIGFLFTVKIATWQISGYLRQIFQPGF